MTSVLDMLAVSCILRIAKSKTLGQSSLQVGEFGGPDFLTPPPTPTGLHAVSLQERHPSSLWLAHGIEHGSNPSS